MTWSMTPPAVAAVLQRLPNARRTEHGWSARCPAHEDRHASLSLGIGRNGRCLVKCFAGCEPTAIVKALGLELNDLFDRTAAPDDDGRVPHQAIVATYDYRAADGRLLFQVVRFAPKTFRQRHREAGGKWVWGRGEGPVVLYRLPELLADAEHTVYLPEGERDVNCLVRAGLCATTNPGGAGKWRADFSTCLQGRRVVVLPDNDGPGLAHACDVAVALAGVAASVRVVELPGVPAKGDVSDWFQAGGTREELQRLEAAAEDGATWVARRFPGAKP